MSDKRRKDTDDLGKTISPEDNRTIEMDRFALMNQVSRDIKSSEDQTIKLPPVYSKPTVPMAAIAVTKPDFDTISLTMEELDVELEPIDDEDRVQTTQIPVRLEFYAVVEPGGVLRIPKEMLDSGHIKAGMQLRLIASQKT